MALVLLLLPIIAKVVWIQNGRETICCPKVSGDTNAAVNSMDKYVHINAETILQPVTINRKKLIYKRFLDGMARLINA